MSSKNKVIFKGTPYIIKNKNFSTIDFEFVYHVKFDNKYLFYLHMLKQLLFNTSFNYKSEQEYKEEYKKSMIVNMNMGKNIYNENLFIRFKLTVLDPKKVKNYDIERAFNFFIDSIYNPNVIDNEFNKDVFEREREYLKSDILSSLKNIYIESSQGFLKAVDDDGILKDNIYNNMHLIDEANPKELYEIYKELIFNNRPVILVYGDVDNSINDLISKYIPVSNKKISFDKNYYHYLKPYDEVKLVEENSRYNQSVLYVAFKVIGMSETDDLYLNIVKNILGTGVEGLVFKKLRVEEGLVYSSSTWYSKTAGVLVIESYINNNSKDKVLECIKEVVSSLKDKKFLREKLDRLIENLYYSSIREKDSKYRKLSDFALKKIGYDCTSLELLEKYKNLDIDLLLEFIDRLKLDTIYFYRGEFNEEEKDI